MRSTALAAFLLSLACAAGEDAGPAPVAVRPLKAGDLASVSSGHASGVVVTITSISGIGSATISRSGDSWPDRILLRFALKGLESIEADNGLFTASTFLGSKQAPECWRINEAGVRVELAGNTPLLDPRRTDAGIEVRLGGGIFRTDVREITIRWVDFHRR